MIDRISRASPSSIVDEELRSGASVKNFEQPQAYEAPKTFRQHLQVIQRANQVVQMAPIVPTEIVI
jgi:hypothetical protein